MENSSLYSKKSSCILSHAEPFISITGVQKAFQNQHARKENNRKLKKDCKYSILTEKYLTQQDIPAWYRELSFAQMEAADSLHDAITEDLKKETIIRSRGALINLRIYPIPRAANIKNLLGLSCGNDIMFLWTLLQGFYEDHINMQILMSSICHLDMITTLREMDKIIPKKRSSKNFENITKRHNRIRFNEGGDCACPFLEPLRCPKPKDDAKSKQFGFLYKPDFSPYNKYLDKTYVIKNESTRWFQSNIDSAAIHEETNCDNWNKKLEILNFVYSKYSNLNDIVQDLLKELKQENVHDVQLIMNIQADKIAETNQLQSEDNFKKFIENLQIQAWKRVLIKNILENEEKLQKVKICEICEFHYITNKEKCIQFLNAGQHSTLMQHVYTNLFFDDLVDKINTSGPGTNLAFELENLLKDNEVVSVCVKDILPIKFTLLRKKNIINKKLRKSNGIEKYIDRKILSAINRMKKHSKFVLAKLPEAHKVPVLREWMKVRLGLKYSIKDKLTALRESKKIFDSIKALRIPQLVPKIKDISEKNIVSYSEKNLLLKKKEQILTDFYRNLKGNLLNDCRVFWQLMAPHCSKDILKRNFYAYMPSSGNDILPFRIWQPHEYHNNSK